MEEPPKDFFRLAPGREVRLRYGLLHQLRRGRQGRGGRDHRAALHLRSGHARRRLAADGRKVKGTLHWVPRQRAPTAEVRLYDRLFSAEQPDRDKEQDFNELLNPNSLEVVSGAPCRAVARAAPTPATASSSSASGYFCVDPKDSKPGAPVFNRTVTLKDSWAKEQSKQK